MKGSTVLLSGATGFIGPHLVKALLDREAEILVLARPTSRFQDAWRGRVTRIDCEDWTADGVQRVLEPYAFDTVFHLLSYGVRPTDRDPATLVRINSDLGVALVHLCKSRKAGIIVAGSNTEYLEATPSTLMTEHSPLETVKLYGASKAAGGLLASALAAETGVPMRLLRIFNAYGPGEHSYRLIPSLLAGLTKGRRVALSAGTQVRDFVHIDDVVDAFLMAAAQLRSDPPRAAIWNVGTGIGTDIRTFARMVAAEFGAPDHLLGFGEQPLRKDEVMYLVGDCTRIHADLGWRARHDVASGIRRTLAQLVGGEQAAPPQGRAN